MTSDETALRDLLAKSSDATFLREMIGIARAQVKIAWLTWPITSPASPGSAPELRPRNPTAPTEDGPVVQSRRPSRGQQRHVTA